MTTRRFNVQSLVIIYLPPSRYNLNNVDRGGRKSLNFQAHYVLSVKSGDEQGFALLVNIICLEIF